MNITNVQNPVYSKPDNSQIDCLITCEKGVIPFTARSDDVMSYGNNLYHQLVEGTYGPIAPYTEG